MAIDKALLGPQSDGEKETFAIEALVFSVQIALQRAMQKHGVSNKELASRLGMSPARVSQIFSSNGPNLTLRTIARIQHALGEEFELINRTDVEVPKPKADIRSFKVVSSLQRSAAWEETSWNNLGLRTRARAA